MSANVPVTNWRTMADGLAEELRRMPCRISDPKTCRRCIRLNAYDLAVADAAIVQKPGEPQCLHAYPVVDGKCGGCRESV